MSEPTFYQIMPVIEEVLQLKGTVKMKPAGVSMLPFIRGDYDEVLLCKPLMPLMCGKIYLYKRNNGKFVLHRLVGKCGDELFFRGDNQIRKETGIGENQIIAEVTQVIRGKKVIRPGDFTYFLYRHFALISAFFRRLCKYFCFAIKVLKNKVS